MGQGFKNLLIALLFYIFSPPLGADQPAYLSHKNALHALENLSHHQQRPCIISFCSLCQDERIETWQIKDAKVARTGYKNYYEILVFYKTLFKSELTYRVGEYQEPVQFEPATNNGQTEEDQYPLTGVDLAYIYIPTKKGIFLNYGKMLGFPCMVEVDQIALPEDLNKKLQKSWNPEQSK